MVAVVHIINVFHYGAQEWTRSHLRSFLTLGVQDFMGLCAMPPSLHPPIPDRGVLFSPQEATQWSLSFLGSEVEVETGISEIGGFSWAVIRCRRTSSGRGWQGSERAHSGQFVSFDGGCLTAEPLHLHGVSF